MSDIGPFPTFKPDVTLGLVSRWKMDEGAGTTTADDIGGITATMGGTPNPSWLSGSNNNGALLSSGTARLDAGTAATYSFMENTGEWTVNLWFKATDFTSGGIHAFWCTSDGSSKGVFVGLNNPSGTARLRIIVRTAGGLVGSINDLPVTDNNWHMATFVSHFAGSIVYVYLDASIGTSTTLSGTGTGDSSQAAKFFDDGAADYFSGGLDDVRIYNRQLSSFEVTTLFINGAQ